MTDMGNGLTLVLTVVVGIALAILVGVSRKPMQDSAEAKFRTMITKAHDRAKAKLEALRAERRSIVAQYLKKADAHRIAEAKKRLENI